MKKTKRKSANEKLMLLFDFSKADNWKSAKAKE